MPTSDDEAEDITKEELARRGNLTSDNHRPAHKCPDCLAVWYGRARTPANGHGRPVTRYCPWCGRENVEEPDLPGVLLLNPGVEWPGDDPFVGGDS